MFAASQSAWYFGWMAGSYTKRFGGMETQMVGISNAWQIPCSFDIAWSICDASCDMARLGEGGHQGCMTQAELRKTNLTDP